MKYILAALTLAAALVIAQAGDRYFRGYDANGNNALWLVPHNTLI